MQLLRDNQVVLQWIPAPVGVPRNERADKLAKEGRRKAQTPTRSSYTEAKTIIKNNYRKEQRLRNNKCNSQTHNISSLDRKQQIFIYHAMKSLAPLVIRY